MEEITNLSTLYFWLIALVVWSIPWKGVALWRAARRGDKVWFVMLLVINTFAILEILYILLFSKKTPAVREQADRFIVT